MSISSISIEDSFDISFEKHVEKYEEYKSAPFISNIFYALS